MRILVAADTLCRGVDRQGYEPSALGSEEFSACIRAELGKWGVPCASNIRAE